MSTKSLDHSKLLVVDDEKGIRDIFVHVLSHHLPDVRADVVANGAEAVEAFMDGHYAVILMDIHMPHMNGEQAFKAIMKHCQENALEMPSVVFCTGFEPPTALMKEIADNPMHCILRKPVRNEDLIEALKSRLKTK